MALVLKIKGAGANKAISKARRALLQGKTVIYPTESSYALGGNALSPTAVEKIRKIKGNREGKPFSVIVANLSMAKKIGFISKKGEALVKEFMPGPLTLVVKKKGLLAKGLCNKEVAFRISSNKIALALSRACNRPLVATSANRSGEGAVYSTKQAIKEFGELVDVIIDAGSLPKRSASTIFDVEKGVVLRRGAVSVAKINKVIARAEKVVKKLHKK